MVMNKFSSTAYLDSKGHYVPCSTNQEWTARPKADHSLGQLKHVSKQQGYCEHLVLGGCDKDV